MLQLPVVGRKGHDPVRHRAIGDEMLHPVEHEMIALAPITRAHRRDIRAGSGLGYRKGAEAELLDQRSEVSALLLRTASHQDWEGREIIRRNRVRNPGASIVQFLC